MPKHNIKTAGFLSLIAFLLLIIDTRTVLSGALEGLDLCVKSIIPSLFPFLFVTNIITSSLSGCKIPLISSLTRRLGIPAGAETIVTLGFLSGYPVGAQNINIMFRKNMLDQNTAQHMLAFCNNAGPAFIFGILSPLFDKQTAVWGLWGIHIASALIVSLVFSNKTSQISHRDEESKFSATKSMEQAVRSMALICGWVLLFRIIITILQRWLFWMLPNHISVLFSGLLELSNGCLMLKDIPLQGTRFVYSALLLSIGGVCVGMQTLSVTEDVGIGLYFPGKILQSCLSVLMASSLQYVLFSPTEVYLNLYLPAFCAISAVTIILINRKSKNKYSNLQKLIV